jgi:RNA polymerase sigma factor (sigma-70 family)
MKQTDSTVDGWLVLQYQSGNNKALPLLVRRWHKKFCNGAFWVTRDAAASKDIAQESWKVIIEQLKRLKDEKSFGSWALTIVHRRSIDWIRANKKESKKLNKYYNEQSVIEEEESDNEHLKKELLKAIKALPEQQQTVIRLFYIEDYSLREISEILNISIGTVKSRLFHAREKLKLILKNRTHEN